MVLPYIVKYALLRIAVPYFWIITCWESKHETYLELILSCLSSGDRAGVLSLLLSLLLAIIRRFSIENGDEANNGDGVVDDVKQQLFILLRCKSNSISLSRSCICICLWVIKYCFLKYLWYFIKSKRLGIKTSKKYFLQWNLFFQNGLFRPILKVIKLLFQIFEINKMLYSQFEKKTTIILNCRPECDRSAMDNKHVKRLVRSSLD